MGNNCQGGQVAASQLNNNDCPQCKSIVGIVPSADLLSWIVKYSDGSSQTIPLPPLPRGPQGVPGKNSTSVINNFLVDKSTLSTSFETLYTASTVASDSSKNLTNDGDYLELYANLTTTNTGGTSKTRVLLNGTPLTFNVDFYTANINTIEILMRVDRVNSTSMRITITATYSAGDGLQQAAVPGPQGFIIDLPGQDFTINNLFALQAQSAVIGDVTAHVYTNTIFKTA